MTATTTPRSALWSAQAHMPSILGQQIVITGGQGAYVTTDQGEKLLDATAGLWHANVGHGREDLARAAYEQLIKLETYHVFNRFANDVAVRLADRLAAYAPFVDAKVIFGSGGSEAIEISCKLARRHWQLAGRSAKKIVLSRNFAYHGIHAYGTSIAGIETNREGYGTESLIPETARVHHSDLGKVLERVLEIGPDNIAAIVLEPVMGTGGVFPPSPGYLEGVQRIASEHEILIIADEVITGFGRMGTMFACDHFGFVPDMLLMAKGITSGYLPLSGVLIAPRIWKAFYDGPDAPVYRHGTTYAGHATACAVAMAHLDILENENLIARAGELGGILDRALDVLRAHPFVTDVRAAGLLAGVELASEVPGDAVADYALAHGVILRVLRGNTIQISPPFIVTDTEVKTIVDTIADGIDATIATL